MLTHHHIPLANSPQYNACFLNSSWNFANSSWESANSSWVQTPENRKAQIKRPTPIVSHIYIYSNIERESTTTEYHSVASSHLSTAPPPWPSSSQGVVGDGTSVGTGISVGDSTRPSNIAPSGARGIHNGMTLSDLHDVSG